MWKNVRTAHKYGMPVRLRPAPPTIKGFSSTVERRFIFKDRSKQLAYLHEYNKKYQKERYEKRKIELMNSLGGKCARCGAQHNLEFHHVDKATKEFSIMRRWKEDVSEELKKCVLLCHECHLAEHKL